MKSWNKYTNIKPPLGVEVLAQKDEWIDKDSSPIGIRVGYRYKTQGDDLERFYSLKSLGVSTGYYTIEHDEPTYWKSLALKDYGNKD